MRGIPLKWLESFDTRWRSLFCCCTEASAAGNYWYVLWLSCRILFELVTTGLGKTLACSVVVTRTLDECRLYTVTWTCFLVTLELDTFSSWPAVGAGSHPTKANGGALASTAATTADVSGWVVTPGRTLRRNAKAVKRTFIHIDSDHSRRARTCPTLTNATRKSCANVADR